MADSNEYVAVGTWTRMVCDEDAEPVHRDLYGKNKTFLFNDGSLEQLRLQKIMGSGSYGRVKAYVTESGENLCIKKLKSRVEDPEKFRLMLEAIGTSVYVIGAKVGVQMQMMDCGAGSVQRLLAKENVNMDQLVYFLWDAQINLLASEVCNTDMKLDNIVYFNTEVPGEYVFKLVDIDGMRPMGDKDFNIATYPYCGSRYTPIMQSLYAAFFVSVVCLFPEKRQQLYRELKYDQMCRQGCSGSGACGVQQIYRIIGGFDQLPDFLKRMVRNVRLVTDLEYDEKQADEDRIEIIENLGEIIFQDDRRTLKNWHDTYYAGYIDPLPVQEPMTMCMTEIGMRCGFANARVY